MNRFEFIEVATDYLNRGWNPVCIHKLHKHPKGMSWEHFNEVIVTEEDIQKMAVQYEKDILNIGIITGKISGVTVVDIDGEEGFKSLEENGIILPETLMARTGRVGDKGTHYFFKYDPNIKGGSHIQGLSKVDIRNNGGLVVAPPSQHVTGNNYHWLNEGAPILEFPQDLKNLIKEREKSKKKDDEGKPLYERLKEGNRDSTLISIAGSMRNLGFSEDTILMTIMRENEMSAEPLEEWQVEKIVRSAYRYPISEKKYTFDEIGTRDRFIDSHKDLYIYNLEEKDFMRYDGKKWTFDGTRADMHDKFIARMLLIPNEIDKDDDDDKGTLMKSAEKFKKLTRSFTFMNRVLDSGVAPMVSKSKTVFDSSNFLLNLNNGTYDIKKDEFRAHNKLDYMRKISSINYDKDARCPTWDGFIDWAFKGDKDLIRYVQKAVGYSLTGSIKEQVIFLLHGSGGNGKSTFIDTISAVLGEYSGTADVNTFVATKNASNSAEYDIASLVGTRFVAVSESNKGVALDESRVKKLTGNKSYKARNPYEKPFVFEPTFKLFLETNHMPKITDDGNAMWRRLKKIPFDNAVTEETKDTNLTNKLIEEIQGILNWCIEGARMYMSEGLGTCETVEMSTREYRLDGDYLHQFLTECTTESVGNTIRTSDLRSTYLTWLDYVTDGDTDYVYVHSAKEFVNALKVKGFNIKKSGVNIVSDIAVKLDIEKELKRSSTASALGVVKIHNGSF